MEEEILERTLYYGLYYGANPLLQRDAGVAGVSLLVLLLLGYLSWYCYCWGISLGTVIYSLSMSNPSLEELFNPPVVNHSWKRKVAVDDRIRRYGFLWHCWDLEDGFLGEYPLRYHPPLS